MREAASTGELVTVIYDGGFDPGTARKIAVFSVDERYARVQETGQTRTKLYRLDRIAVPEASDVVEWKTQPISRGRGKYIEPDSVFKDWAFYVLAEHWPIFGIALREYINKTATAVARAEAAARGMNSADVARIAVRDLHWSKIESQPQFCEGDLFWLRDKSAALEVVAIREFLEVHFVLRNYGRTAFHLKAEQLEDWLEHGVPENTRPIAPALSYSDILRFFIHHPV